MEVGYFAMPLHPPGADPTRTLEDDLAQIVLLDELGYKEAWIGEHFTTVWENIPAPDLFIAMALAKTRNIVLGTGVSCMPNHNPFMLAQRIAQLDHQARGRFQWGVGSGGFPGDFEVFGFDPATGAHRGMTRDAIDLVLQLWDDPKPGLYEHPYWRFTIPEPVDDIGLRLHLQAVPEAAPAHRRRWRVPQVRHPRPGRRARLDSLEHKPGSDGHPADALGCRRRRRCQGRPNPGPGRLAHRPRGVRGGDRRRGPPRGSRRGAQS